jgi:phosphatidate phosphatase APP1
MLYRFLALNEFPSDPLFLKQYVHIRQYLWNKISGKKNLHKRTMLEKIIELFPDKKYILIGDNTQHDPEVYLELTKLHPQNVKYIIIREVVMRPEDRSVILAARDSLKQHNIDLYYEKEFPDTLWEL